MFGRKTRARLNALERDWSPLINSVLGQISEVERRLSDSSRVELGELGRRMYDVERLLETDHDRIDNLELAVEDRPKLLPRSREA